MSNPQEVNAFRKMVRGIVPEHAFINETSTQVHFVWTTRDNTWTVYGEKVDSGQGVGLVVVHDHYDDTKITLRGMGVDHLSAILRAVGAVSVKE